MAKDKSGKSASHKAAEKHMERAAHHHAKAEHHHEKAKEAMSKVGTVKEEKKMAAKGDYKGNKAPRAKKKEKC